MDFLRALGIVVGSFGAIFITLRNAPARMRKRSTLKADLEIYALLEPSDPHREVVKASIDASIQRLYRPGSDRKVWDLTSLVLGCVMLAGFGAWSAYLLRNGFAWWALPTVFFAVMGAVGISQGFEPPSQPKDDHLIDGR